MTIVAVSAGGQVEPGHRRLFRATRGRVLAGVAQGLADHLGLDVLLVRIAFVVLAAAGGAGVAMYAAFWVLTPLDAGVAAEESNRNRDVGVVLALALVVLGGGLVASAAGFGVQPHVTVPLLAVAAGLALLWRQADDSQRARLRAATVSHRRTGAVRAAAGAALVLLGVGALVVGAVHVAGGLGAVLAALVIVAGVALVSAPWWLRMARDLAAERSARIREQERAEVAAHVHDSVLHTLTLIQRHVDDPREIARLARAQERELRSWLYRPTAEPGSTVEAGLEQVAAEVEDAHGVAVELVVVSDADLDERLRALLQATREALVNAAKYAGDGPISVYAEVEPQQVTVFVRDRGPGFDPVAVPADRLGLRESVVGRMQRNGGTAEVRSRVGAGTEVQLSMPRSQS